MPIGTSRLVVAFGVLAWAGSPAAGAPALKERTAENGDPDLRALHALIRKAVEDGKAISASDEQRLDDTTRALLKRAAQAADIKQRDVPVKRDGLTKSEVTKAFRQTSVRGALVVGGEVRGTGARDSILLAAGEVHFTSIENCLVVGKTVRFTGARNCVIIAEEFVRGTGVGRGKEEPDGSIIVSGRWIRLTSATDVVCHVLQPGKDPAPDEREGLALPPIRMTSARNVRFLNKPDDVGTTSRTDSQCLELKRPLAK
ncbi:MAG: hypothetical protein J2P46_09715 [Zavarzinella sp.]|nr:hypothetical protein [Zavarzinella sp.]